MTNEFKHGSVGTELTQAEYEAIGGHVFDSQATGDILYASSATQLSKLAIGSTNNLLTISGGVPAWTATPTVTSITTSLFDLGTSASPVSYTAGSPVFELYATSSNATSTNAEPFYVKSVMTGANGYGGRSRFHAYTNVALTTNFMALKAYTEFGSSGSVTGLAAGFCAEILMPNASVGGSYYALELEYVAGGTSTNPASCGWIYMNNTGDSNGDFDDNGVLFDINGLTADSGHLYDTTASDSGGDATLKIKVNGTVKYLLIADDAN
jgi:hypothetical protein